MTDADFSVSNIGSWHDRGGTYLITIPRYCAAFTLPSSPVSLREEPLYAVSPPVITSKQTAMTISKMRLHCGEALQQSFNSYSWNDVLKGRGGNGKPHRSKTSIVASTMLSTREKMSYRLVSSLLIIWMGFRDYKLRRERAGMAVIGLSCRSIPGLLLLSQLVWLNLGWAELDTWRWRSQVRKSSLVVGYRNEYFGWTWFLSWLQGNDLRACRGCHWFSHRI